MKAKILLWLGISIFLKSCNTRDEQVEERIVSLNGAITETIVALGAEERIVAVDISSTFPEKVKKMAKVLGHSHSISLEPILALKPNLVLGLKNEISPELEVKLTHANVRVKLIEQEYSPKGAQDLIEQVGEAIGLWNCRPVVVQMQADLYKVSPLSRPVKVLCIYARGAGNLMVAGEKTAFSEMLKLAGGENAVSGLEYFKPLTKETIIQSNPDVLLLFDSGLASVGGIAGLLEIPGFSSTTAGQRKNILSFEGGLLTNFGPRTGEASLALNRALLELQDSLD
jgi:iron complex transport system substrate-binding protein